MSDDGAHAYCFLLGRAWEDGGYLKNDDRFLARASRMSPRRWNKVSEEVRERFQVDEDGRLFHPRLVDDYDALMQKRENNRRNSVSRWSRLSNKNNEPTNAIASKSHSQPEPELKRKKERDSESSNDSESRTGERYAFAGTIIKLTETDFRKWEKAYPTITDLKSELQAIDDWLLDKGRVDKWFFSVSSMLKRTHQKNLKDGVSGERGNGSLDITDPRNAERLGL